MIDSIQNILVQVSDFLWSYIIITVLICCALFFTWRTRFVQFRLIREMIRLLIHPDKIQPEEIGHDELSMEVKVDGEMKHTDTKLYAMLKDALSVIQDSQNKGNQARKKLPPIVQCHLVNPPTSYAGRRIA